MRNHEPQALLLAAQTHLDEAHVGTLVGAVHGNLRNSLYPRLPACPWQRQRSRPRQPIETKQEKEKWGRARGCAPERC